ncbi:MAG: hypothetical protein WCD18_19100 [Thermosynechococcaceae cyanobacterium]
MSKIYMYAVVRDLGFAPNPFHGYCTLATCKPKIRNRAKINDWIIGMGGSRLHATGQCIFAMLVTDKLTFNEYWENSTFFDKKPVRNGSWKMMVGDNIYQFDSVKQDWYQADSHHSHEDGSINLHNLYRDTSSDKVLISQNFFYFGSQAPIVPCDLLYEIGYKRNPRDYRVFEYKIAGGLIEWLQKSFEGSLNQVLADPFDFKNSYKRYSADNNKFS